MTTDRRSFVVCAGHGGSGRERLVGGSANQSGAICRDFHDREALTPSDECCPSAARGHADRAWSANISAHLQVLRKTGATGLEPATSGVTGRYKANRPSWLRPGITGYSRHFVAEPTGFDRLRPAATRQGLCSTRVVGLVPNSTTESVARVTCSLPGDSGSRRVPAESFATHFLLHIGARLGPLLKSSFASSPGAFRGGRAR
jgi:hypothetical protein